MAELQQLGALDPAAREQLIADLSNTDPAIWPLIIQQFRAAAAYRRRAQQSQMATRGPNRFLPDGSPAWRPGQSVPPEAYPPGQAARSPEHPPPRVEPLPPADAVMLPPPHVPPRDYPTTPYPPVDANLAHRPPENLPPGEATGRVVRASYDPAMQDNWQVSLASATRALESQLPGTPETPDEIAQHARLRLLYLLGGRQSDAVRPIPSIAPAMQQFWSAQLYGLHTLLDTRQTPDATTRADETKRILGDAVTWLGEAAPLTVRNLAFCTEIQSFGCIKEFKKNEFVPEQEVLLYAEVENFTSESTAKGYHTALCSSYQIFDSRNQRVADHEFTTTEEYCQRPRRDYFIGYHLRLPKRIYPGKHTLQLTIEDLKGKKIGQASIECTIKSGDD